MNGEKLADCLGDIDDRYVREAAPGNRPAKKRRWALGGLAAAAVLVLAVAMGPSRFWTAPEPAVTAEPGPSEVIDDGPGAAPGCIVWHGYAYVSRGYFVHEMPEGLELLGEAERSVKVGGIMPEDAPDLSTNFGEGRAYMFPGNESLIVFRYKEWNVEEELGREEPILLMYREFHFFGTEDDTPYYRDLAGMVGDADIIVKGVIVRPGQEAEPGEDAYTVRVTDVLSGGVNVEDEIRVSVPAGSGRLEGSDADTYLLFLRRDGNGGFRPVSRLQGVYPVTFPGKGEYVLVPNDDQYMLWASGRIIDPPYTHVRFAMSAIRERIMFYVDAEPLP